MLLLRSLGGLELEGLDRPLDGAALRPRSLALLALIGSGRERGVSRDGLLVYFWPERDTEHARNCLKQILFTLRHDIRDDLLLVTRAGLLRLNPAVITTDALQFEAARARGAHTAAIALYRGAFLGAVHLADLRELEQWVEGERAWLALGYQASLEALGAAAYEAGDYAAAVAWWRKLTTLDPLSSRAALGYMRALVGHGSRPEALLYARVYERLVRGELGTPPDMTITAYAEWLRQHPEARSRRWLRTGSLGQR